MSTKNSLEEIQVTKGSFECSLTTDIVLFGYLEGQLKLLLTKRGVGEMEKVWLLPGGVMYKNETLESCAKKVLKILTGIDGVHFEQVKGYSSLERHPLKRVVTTSFLALTKIQKHSFVPGNDVSDIAWFGIENLPRVIGFDHQKIIRDAHIFFKTNLKDDLVINELLPQLFTLQELQEVYEQILETTLDRRNFRKRIAQLGLIEATGDKKSGIKGGPYLYRLKRIEQNL